ncbi:hypothetical protein HC931_22955 [Candidatus Gracilibacteria bacterium]|nr:hypothetical protein [Candidatus Gracilibacteria bacterium]NJM88310.1 hypothetical protein [Hydrococcus sp. RU_2_2]
MPFKFVKKIFIRGLKEEVINRIEELYSKKEKRLVDKIAKATTIAKLEADGFVTFIFAMSLTIGTGLTPSYNQSKYLIGPLALTSLLICIETASARKKKE